MFTVMRTRPTIAFQRLLVARAGCRFEQLFTSTNIVRGCRPHFLSAPWNRQIVFMGYSPITGHNQLSTVAETTTMSQVSALINSLCDSSSEHEVVRDYLSEVKDQVLRCSDDSMTAQQAYDVMFGLQGMVKLRCKIFVYHYKLLLLLSYGIFVILFLI